MINFKQYQMTNEIHILPVVSYNVQTSFTPVRCMINRPPGFIHLEWWDILSLDTTNLEISKSDAKMTVTFWNLAGASAALLPIRLSNFRSIEHA